MADHVKEEIVTPRQKVVPMIGYVVFTIFAFISAIVAATYLMAVMSSFNLMNVLMVVIFGGGAWMMWWGKDMLRVEYEYSFTNGVVDVSQVINNRRRKDVVSFRTREADLVAPADDPRLAELRKRKDVKIIRAYLNPGARLYFAQFRKGDSTVVLLFEPSEEFLKLMRIYNERNVVL